jgi:aryl-alcohol dehydrogenase-like predicted oxidoreductase
LEEISPMLPRRPLGNTGLTAPILGFGVSGPLGLPLVSEKDAIGLILEAYRGGARLFDTAPFYGLCEARLGKALTALPRSSYALITKAGTRRQDGVLHKDFTPAGVRATLVSSLNRLRTDHADALLLHGPAPADLTDALKAELEALKAEGRLQAYGICGRGPEILAALERGFAPIVQAPAFEGVDGRLWSEIAAERGAGFLAIEALRGGGLRLPRSPADLWYLARALRQGGSRALYAPAEALRRALTQPGVSAVIATTTRLAHLRANLAIAAQIG